MGAAAWTFWQACAAKQATLRQLCPLRSRSGSTCTLCRPAAPPVVVVKKKPEVVVVKKKPVVVVVKKKPPPPECTGAV